jgi:hypothetical protein
MRTLVELIEEIDEFDDLPLTRISVPSTDPSPGTATFNAEDCERPIYSTAALKAFFE